MEVCALASGSSGNCFFIGNKKSGFLVDAGISSKRIVESLAKIGKTPEQIKGIVITHEHTDHIKGADVFSRNFKVPIYINEETLASRFICSNEDLIKIFDEDETFDLAGLEINSFLKFHKAAKPLFFNIHEKKTKRNVSIITDAGYCCKNINEVISESNFVFLESNHDVKMLEDGPYPWHLKKWIKSDEGHLSNSQASLGVLEHAKPKLKNLVLSHISKTNNLPELAVKTFGDILKERKDINANVSISYADKPTEVFVV